LIGGCSRTGKTTLSEKLIKMSKIADINSIYVRLDNWLLGINERSGKETVTERFNYPAIIESVKAIKRGEKVFPPIYDPKTRLVTRGKSSQFIQIESGICIIDGVIALDIPELRDLSDFKIYTEVKDEIRKKRLMEFYNQYKKCSLLESKSIIEARELEEVPYIKKTKIFADFVFQSEN
jgi:uridine kinase